MADFGIFFSERKGHKKKFSIFYSCCTLKCCQLLINGQILLKILLDSFLKWQKSASHFSRFFFFSISPKVLDRNPWKSVWYLILSNYTIGIECSWKNTKIKKNIFLPKRRWFDPKKYKGYLHIRRRDQTLSDSSFKFHIGVAIILGQKSAEIRNFHFLYSIRTRYFHFHINPQNFW